MTRGNVKAEQINNQCDVLRDFGEILSKNEMADILTAHFRDTVYRNGCVFGAYNGVKYCIYFKNVSYLGAPHPLFKKRIQIGENFKEIYEDNEAQGVQTLLVGVYRYGDVLLFVDFDAEGYAKRKAHNSSAHVYTLDLRNGLQFGLFQKKDANENTITVFTTQNVERYLQSKTGGTADLRFGFIKILDEFYTSLPKYWHGISAYREMMDAGFNNALQSEWPGFYHEFKLEQYIGSHAVSGFIQYRQNKKKGEIDLDLFFPVEDAYGDLKAHSNGSGGIQGNDWDTVMNIVEHRSVFYIVCNHDTEPDREHGHEVTVFWNTQLHKKHLHSYAEKMKNSVSLTSYCVLEINRFNKQYLKIFRQGHNADGKPRKPKISISNRDIGNFLIHQMIF